MKQRILVVDDDRMVADTLNLIFQANGYESEAVYSAAAGLERARTFTPGLLLCDVTMPLETGLQLADKLHAEQPNCKVLMLSAYSSNAAKVRDHASLNNRSLKLLNKPCRPEELLHEAKLLLKTA
jgi:DNA-binding response OmpR family regulator